MKIAVCFSGQMRTGVEASSNLIRFFGDLYDDCDIFIHTWGNNTTKPYNGFYRSESSEEIVNEDTFKKIVEIYSPKKILIEDITEIGQLGKLGRLSPQWYSFMKSVELKSNFEVENDIIYDYVLKVRPDLIFKEGRTLVQDLSLMENDEFYVENVFVFPVQPGDNLDDVFYIGNSSDMSHASSYVNKIIELDKNKPEIESSVGYKFSNHLLSIGIKITGGIKWPIYYERNDTNLYGYTIYRKECFKYSPLTEFEECLKCERYHFNPIGSLDTGRYYSTDMKITKSNIK